MNPTILKLTIVHTKRISFQKAVLNTSMARRQRHWCMKPMVAECKFPKTAGPVGKKSDILSLELMNLTPVLTMGYI